MRKAVAVVALAGAGLLVGYRVRSQRARAWSAVERMCACNEPALAQMSALRSVATGGLDRVLTAQAHALQASCDDLRVAAHRRGVGDALRATPLRVEPSTVSTTAAREVGRALGLMCGEEHRAFWEGLRTRVTREESTPGETRPEVLRWAREHLRVHDAMCAESRRLAAPLAGYAMTLAEAERTGQSCGR
jgi:hypothetical protein